jgi:Neuraminidase (sialidase)
LSGTVADARLTANVPLKDAANAYTGGLQTISSERSIDGGRTWSAPSKIAKLGTVAESADGEPLRVGDYLPDLAVDRDSGALYATWADGLGGSTNKIVLSRSTDGGQHWSTPAIVSHHNSAQSFNHAVEVANDGEVAVLYYDDNDNTVKVENTVDIVAWLAPKAMPSGLRKTPKQ